MPASPADEVTERRVLVVSAGLSQPSSTRLLADRLAAATERALRDVEIQPSTEVIELRAHAQDLVNHLLTGFPSPSLEETIGRVAAADGLIAVTPIFSASYTGLFKMFFDLLERDGLSGRPVLIGATGGTARHSLALEHAVRPLFAYFNAAVVPTAVFAAAEDWGGTGAETDAGLAARIERAGAELAAWVARRKTVPAVDAFAEPVAFTDLLDAARRPD